MNVTFISHASILVEVEGVRIISDPWWRGPCFGAQWWNYPLPYLQALERARVNFIYISHGHHDHFHPSTLRTFDRDITVLVSKEIDLADSIRALGFSVVELDSNEEFTLGGNARCRIMRSDGTDTLMAISDGSETFINLNDALHSAPTDVQDRFIKHLRDIYPTIDYLFCGYGVASHFPNCYFIPGKDRDATAIKRQRYFNRQWARIVHGLAPRFAFPFAADVVFLEEDLQWVNEPTHNAERPGDVFAKLYPDSNVQVYDIAPGFNIDAGVIGRKQLRERISIDAVKGECKEAVARANGYGNVSSASVAEIRALLETNLSNCREYCASYDGDYRFLIKFRNGVDAIEITKSGKHVSTAIVELARIDERSYDVVYTTRLAYLRQSLTTEFGYEILFVGSGGVFNYADRTKACSNLHRELTTIMRRQIEKRSARAGTRSRSVYKLKRALKALLGRSDLDLYDLREWTVFKT